MSTVRFLADSDFKKYYNPSLFRVECSDCNPYEMVDGFNEAFVEKGIGTPKEWIGFTGKQANRVLNLSGEYCFTEGTLYLTFPYEDLDMTKLAELEKDTQRWFDEVEKVVRKNAQKAGGK